MQKSIYTILKLNAEIFFSISQSETSHHNELTFNAFLRYVIGFQVSLCLYIYIYILHPRFQKLHSNLEPAEFGELCTVLLSS